MASPSRRLSASVRLRSSASTSSTWSSDPDASPTRISATYIAGNSAPCRDSDSAKLSPATNHPPAPRHPPPEPPARHDMGADFGDHRPQPAEVAVGGKQLEPVIDPR